MTKQSLAFLLLLIILLASIFLINKEQGAKQITGSMVEEIAEEQSFNITEPLFPWKKSVYIVEFKDPSVIEGIRTQGEDYADYLKQQHEQAASEINKISGNLILNDYQHVFNGMALNLSYYDLLFIQRLPYIKRISPDQISYITLNESIPLISADSAWTLTDENGENVTGKNITIAILDTGVDYTHPDLGGCTNETFIAGNCSKVIAGYDFVNGDNDPMDDNGHGTHVASIAAGNGTFKGVAPDAKIVAYKVCNSGGVCSDSIIMAAIENATKNNYSIISMSLGGTGTEDSPLSIAADNAVNSGVVVVVAAGNSGPSSKTIEKPGSARKVITVGATWKNDTIAYFSSRGPVQTGAIKPDVLAPGGLICAAKLSTWNTTTCYDSQHTPLSGTSMSTPHVAGLAALILQRHKDWKPIDVKMAIRNTADDLGYNITTQGHGRINAFSAVNLTARPCTAEFYSYNLTYSVGNNYQFNGTALCDDFVNYTIYVSSLNASNWTAINYSTQQANNSLLFSIADTNLEDGEYIFKLVVNGQNSSSTDYLIKLIDSYKITHPKNGYLIKNGAEIKGESNSGTLDFVNYTLEYKSVNDSQWSLIDFVENVSVNNGTLGYFNSTFLPSGEYTIRSTIYLANKSLPIVDNVTVKVDKQLKDGWPFETEDPVQGGIKIADLDNDGKDEIIFKTGHQFYSFDSNGSLFVLKSDGSVMEGWPKVVQGSFEKTPALADLDNDGDLEIIYPSANLSIVYAWHHNGSIVNGWPITMSDMPFFYYITGWPVVSDLNKDGNLEVIVGTTGRNINGTLEVYSANGTRMWRVYGISPMFNMAVGDVDGDGFDEILTDSLTNYQNPNGTGTLQKSQLFLLNSTGSIMPGWPLDFSMSKRVVSYTLADLNKDNKLEILFSVINGSEDGTVHGSNTFAIFYNTSNLSGWPIYSKFLNLEMITADIDNNKSLEVILNPFYYSGNLTILYANGSYYPNYPYTLPFALNLPNSVIFFQPAVFDVDGDGKNEILMTAEGPRNVSGKIQYSYAFVYAFDYEVPGVTQGFPLEPAGSSIFSGIEESGPLIADIDKDNKSELVVGIQLYNEESTGLFFDGRVVVWETNQTYNSSLIEWGEALNNIWNTNAYVDLDFDHVGLFDNCPFKYNPLQEDLDNDSRGDACDSVVGNLTDINTTISNLTIKIGNSTDLNKQYNETMDVSFYDNGSLLINFTADFSNYSLFLINLSIEKGKNGTDSYFIVNHLNTSGAKTLYLKKSNPSSNSICFRDEEVLSLSMLISNCTIIRCPGTDGNYSCAVSGDTYIVSGLRHSALIERYIAPQTNPPSGGGGGGGGATGGGVLVAPQIQAEEVVEEAPAAETVIAAEKRKLLPEEQLPVVEQPKEVKVETKTKRDYLLFIIVLAALVAIFSFLLYTKKREKQKSAIFDKV